MSKPLHELRVLAGPQAGASLSLKAGSSVDIGSLSAGGCQVVLRDPQVSEQRVRLHVLQDAVRIEVLAGAVEFEGRRFFAPCSFDWPSFLPVRIGDTVLAVGHPEDKPRWDAALSLALTSACDIGTAFPAPSAPASGPAESDEPARRNAARVAHGFLASLRGQMRGSSAESIPETPQPPEIWLAIGGGLLATCAFGLLAFVSVATPTDAGVELLPQKAVRLLKAVPEFGGLRVEADAEHHLFIRGDLLTLAERARLDRTLANALIKASVEVRVGEQVAAAVGDVYRMNGIQAEIAGASQLAAVGRVRVQTRESDLAHLQSVEAIARRDVPGLTRLEGENMPPTVPPAPIPVPDDPGKRVASIVPGSTPYVVTADGTRYFIGALLPSGHRLASIEDQQVRLDRDGVLSTLKF